MVKSGFLILPYFRFLLASFLTDFTETTWAEAEKPPLIRQDFPQSTSPQIGIVHHFYTWTKKGDQP